MITDSSATPTEVLRAGHDHRQHVAAQLIGAEPVVRSSVPAACRRWTGRRGSYGVQNCASNASAEEKCGDGRAAGKPHEARRCARGSRCHAAPAERSRGLTST